MIHSLLNRKVFFFTAVAKNPSNPQFLHLELEK